MTDAPLVSGPDLARTYHARAYADTWDLVEDYWRVMDYAARRPNLGSQALATRLDRPRSSVGSKTTPATRAVHRERE